MTEKEKLDNEYTKAKTELTETCNKAREELLKIGFKDKISGEIFSKVFSEYWTYKINEIRLMSADKNELQFMIKFEDDETTFIYVEVK